MDFMDLQRAMIMAFTAYRRDTGLDPEVTYLEIHMHPDDLAEVRATASKLYFDIQGFLDDKGILGIPLRLDSDVEVGHPEIRSTWKWVL